MSAVAGNLSGFKPDYELAEWFLTLLDEEQDEFTFQVFPDKKITKNAFWRHGTLDEHRNELTQANSEGCGIFAMINQGDGFGRKHKNVTKIRAAFVDLDGPPLGPVMSGPLEPHVVVQSSEGHWQPYWFVDGLSTHDYSVSQRALQKRYDGDSGILGENDACRVMRLPGFYHMKGEPQMVRIIHESGALPYSRENFLEAFGIDTTKKVTALPANKSISNPRRGIPEGQRDTTLFKHACRHRGRGLRREEVSVLVQELASRCNPPFPPDEAQKKVESAFKYASDYPLNDIGNAKRLIEFEGEQLRFCTHHNKWLIEENGTWFFDNAGRVVEMAKEIVETINAEALNTEDEARRKALTSHARTSGSRTRLENMIHLAKTIRGIPVSANDLDTNPLLLGVQNGVVDLSRGEITTARPEDLITRRIGTAFDATATCPRWEAFVNESLCSRPAMISALQRAVGYTLTGLTDEQVLFFLIGSGANGKSICTSVLQSLLGEYAAQTPTESLMTRKTAGATNDLARLNGKRMVAAAETEQDRAFSEPLIKQLTGSDVIAARFLYAELFEFVPHFKLWISGNYKPTIKGNDYGIWRRIHTIPFDNTVPPDKRDPKLLQKLLSELPGILNWAIQGCLEWQRIGLSPPPEVLNATNEYRNEMDVLGHWIEECCVTGEHISCPASELYESYQNWARSAGEMAMTKTKFGIELSTRFRKSSGRFVTYQGINVVKTPTKQWNGYE